jgi:hypothetical protein
MDQLSKLGCKPVRQNFGDKLADRVDEGNGVVVFDCRSLRHLWEQDHEGVIGVMQVPRVQVSEHVKGTHEVVPDNWPSSLKEAHRETV